MGRRHLAVIVSMVALVAASGAGAQHWSKASALDANGGWTFPQAAPQVGIDAAGDALAAWQNFGDPIYYSTHAPGGAWSAEQAVPSSSGILYGLHVAPNGTATLVSQLGSIFVQDRPTGGAWSAPLALASINYWGEYITGTPLVIFTANEYGDQAIVWEQTAGGGAPETIQAVRRPAGGAWGPVETVVSQPSGGHIPLAGATIGAGGDVLVTWQAYQVVCVYRKCSHENFTVYAAREQAGASGWTVSGALSAAISNTYGYNSTPVVTAAGEGAVIFAPINDNVTVQAVTQNPATLTWSQPATVLSNGAGVSFLPATAGAHARSSLAVNFVGAAGSEIAEVEGDLAKDVWTAPVSLSGADAVSPSNFMAFAGNGSGGLGVLWFDTDGSVRATLRKKSAGTFGAAQTLLAGTCGSECATPGPAAVAVNSAGKAAAVFQQPTAVGSGWTLYAASTN